MIDYIKNLLMKPKEIYTARNMKKKHYFLLILLMALILTSLSTFTIRKDYKHLTDDYQEIQQAIPDYEIVDGQLESKKNSFIYQTDSLVFYFDPDNKIAKELIDTNMQKQSAPIAAALQKDKIYLNILGQSRALKYSDFNMTSQDLQSLVNLDRLSSPLYFIIVLFILYLFQLFLYSMQLLSISIFANLISFVQRTKLSFFQNAKIALMASIIPFLIMGILSALNLSIAYQYELTTLASLFLFYLSIDEFTKRLDAQKQVKK